MVQVFAIDGGHQGYQGSTRDLDVLGSQGSQLKQNLEGLYDLCTQQGIPHSVGQGIRQILCPSVLARPAGAVSISSPFSTLFSGCFLPSLTGVQTKPQIAYWTASWEFYRETIRVIESDQKD